MEALRLAGLQDGEIEIYLALLKLGPTQVTRLARVTSRHRTHIYDTLEKLKERGIVTSVTKQGVREFRAKDPGQIVEYLEQNKRVVEKIVPELRRLQKDVQEDPQIEVYKGKEGIKSILRDQIHVGGEILGLGIDDGKYMEHVPIFMRQFLRQLNEKEMHERLITTKESLQIGGSNTLYRYIDERYFNPTATTVYGDRVAIIIWEPAVIIVRVRSAELADNYKKNFELLWKIAKK